MKILWPIIWIATHVIGSILLVAAIYGALYLFAAPVANSICSVLVFVGDPFYMHITQFDCWH